MVSRVSIIGAGPAGFALAADLQNHGLETLVYSHQTHSRHANDVIKGGILKLGGIMEGHTHLRLTTDIREVVEFSRILILTVPSTGQQTIFDELSQYDLSHHTVIAVPGNLISLLIATEVDVGNILETNLSPYSCRMDGNNLRVFGRKKVVFISALRNDVHPGFYDEIQSIFPMRLKWCSSVVEVSLSNVNGVFHPAMMLMNAGRVESTEGDFLLYRDGLTRSVANAMLAIDQVRMRIGMEFGLRLGSAVDISNECYSQGFTDLVDLARNSPPHNKLRAPGVIEHRNISEDVPDLLVCWHGLAEKLGIDASPIAAIIVLAEMATGMDFRKTGRNMRRLHLDGMGRSDLIAMFSPLLTTQTEARL
ncbi:Vitopine synthase [Colletotrichum orbiculare MAFF 240422]|uniref:Vitopine synthase n=1 Tax=Colletotrichum orbiculare (strain 104-T / ATCC 96160 / CBS 514.97 / LARS 414 / MAFF 240422) TaxID=1213857 RepID=N4UN64_COLOR|nr:Vitopine synthase [Colletotrichum orbiculare MAFF 240422]